MSALLMSLILSILLQNMYYALVDINYLLQYLNDDRTSYIFIKEIPKSPSRYGNIIFKCASSILVSGHKTNIDHTFFIKHNKDSIWSGSKQWGVLQ